MAAPVTGQAGGRLTLDNNIVNAPAAPPDALTVQMDDTQGADNSGVPAGYVPSNATNLLAKPPEEQAAVYANAPMVVYPQGTPDTNRIISPANQKIGI